jgi:hypothetical protein
MEQIHKIIKDLFFYLFCFLFFSEAVIILQREDNTEIILPGKIVLVQMEPIFLKTGQQ